MLKRLSFVLLLILIATAGVAHAQDKKPLFHVINLEGVITVTLGKICR